MCKLHNFSQKLPGGFVQFAQRKISLQKSLEKSEKWCIIKTVDTEQRHGTAKNSVGVLRAERIQIEYY